MAIKIFFSKPKLSHWHKALFLQIFTKFFNIFAPAKISQNSMFVSKTVFSLIIFIILNTIWVKAQLSPTFPAADTIYIFSVLNKDTSKRVLKNRLFHIYDKQGHIREVLLEKFQENTWQYEENGF